MKGNQNAIKKSNNRRLKILIAKTSRGECFRIHLPNSWVRDMGMSRDIRQLKIRYDPLLKEIRIRKGDQTIDDRLNSLRELEGAIFSLKDLDKIVVDILGKTTSTIFNEGLEIDILEYKKIQYSIVSLDDVIDYHIDIDILEEQKFPFDKDMYFKNYDIEMIYKKMTEIDKELFLRNLKVKIIKVSII